MPEPIAEKSENESLHRFHADFRHALLMHRKSRLNLFFRLQFPHEDKLPYAESDTEDGFDFRQWLEEPAPDSICAHRLYSELIARQVKFIHLAQEALQGVSENNLRPRQLINFLRAMHEFDRVADRLDSGITTSLTDIDDLTGLMNRAAMERDIDREQAQSQRTGSPIIVAMIDADHFKKVNDEYGHAVGDVVLETLAERFTESLRPRDRVYRYGGEEFLVLLPDTPLDKARQVLDRLRLRACKHPITDGDISITQCVSVGASAVGGDEDIREAIQRADEALYRAKELGRNRTEIDESTLPSSQSEK